MLNDTAVAEGGGFLNTFYYTLWMKELNALVRMMKEMTTALSPQNRKEFTVSYQFLLLCFRECFRSKFPVFMKLFLVRKL